MECPALVSATPSSSKSATSRADPGALESYRRREPEHSLLYQLVAAEADIVRRAVAQASLYGRGLVTRIDQRVLVGAMREDAPGDGLKVLADRVNEDDPLIGMSAANFIPGQKLR